ncbi:preprotein translocase, YajC subunit [Candidatus Blochmanniella vafra str. BVAF]|uniref:Sec translocon accessory complex subunit YajC n=1 Tax=Blochmanniella vafra (strain BVAF) TaxID=859654 RepID=E8Q614_BLOVB|nr:preprotein translocase subunit YajC [Candidatus Blochmannia vafer]ADV33630.1 preprotein translocase, YajC subunit [Candidatus Blochmannia vafer str. BVAF]
MSWLINKVWANSNTVDQGNPYSLIIMLLLFAIIFYFVIFRPQQKRNKEHKELLNSITKGDEIITSGGLVGRVLRITETGYIFITLNFKDTDINNEVLIKKDCVTAILPKGTVKAL